MDVRLRTCWLLVAVLWRGCERTDFDVDGDVVWGDVVWRLRSAVGSGFGYSMWRGSLSLSPQPRR